MAANENNEKYIAKAWINDGKDEEFKTSFLQSLLQQLQGHKDDSTGLNADRLDGKHYTEIHDEIIERTVGLLSSIEIGNVAFTPTNNKSDLPFDVIKINIDGHTYSYSDDANLEKYQLPWAIEDDEDETVVNLNMVFARLYDIVTDGFENFISTEEMDEITNNYLTPLKSFKDTLDNAGALTSDGRLNASAVNGFSFYLRTQSAYDAESETIKKNPRNVFIIIDDDTAESLSTDEDFSGDYDYLLSQQPDTAVISKYYEFRVKEKEVSETVEGSNGETTSVLVKEKWLQYRHQNQAVEKREDETEEEWEARDDATWKDMVETSDFVDNNTIIQLLMTAFEQNNNFKINPESLFNSLKELPIDDSTALPLVKYIKNSGIRGIKSKYITGSLTSNPPEDDNPNGEPRYISLDAFSNKLEEIMDEKIAANFDKIYPIGSIYMSVKNVNPATLFGGTWDKLEDRFLLGSGSIYSATYDTNGFANKTSGTSSVTLGQNHMPSHSHTTKAHSHHPKDDSDKSSQYRFVAVAPGDGEPNSKPDLKLPSTNTVNIQKISDKYTGSSSLMYASDTGWVAEKRDTETSGVTVNSTGNGEAHDNMPPYLVVNIWRRIA